MKDAKDLIPWTVTDISIRPYEGLWSFNPSIHFDGALWRCVLRCCDYAMPEGKTIRSPKAGPGHQSKNAMVIFDPATWKPILIFKMHERDDHRRAASANVGYEDMRIFKTDKGGLQGIAASLHLKRDNKGRTEGSSQHQPPEQVLLSFDGEYNIVAARPLRGDGWSGPQKNWVPFDDCVEPRFLYSIGNGRMFDDRGPVHGDAAVVRPSANARPVPSNVTVTAAPETEPAATVTAEPAREDLERQEQEERARRDREAHEKRSRSRHPDPRTRIQSRGAEVKMVRGGRIVVDTSASRSSSFPRSSSGPASSDRLGGSRRVPSDGNGSARMLGTGRALLPKYEGLRGGTQLVRIGEDAWLGIGHEMRFEKGLKYYWHVWYLTNSKGKMTAASESMKLVPNGIEFAAGLAIDGDRVVVSFGVDDMECKLGETQLSAVLGILRPVER